MAVNHPQPYSDPRNLEPRQLADPCQVCGEPLWLVPGTVGGWYACCENDRIDHQGYGRYRFLGWSDSVLRFVRFATEGQS